jgi:hypothetical protein
MRLSHDGLASAQLLDQPVDYQQGDQQRDRKRHF